MDQIKVAGFISTLRGRLKDDQLDGLLKSFQSFDEVTEYIYKNGGDRRISNTESLLLAAMHACYILGIDTRIVRLKDFFSLNKNDTNHEKELERTLKGVEGFLLSTPVYFGDRSSLTGDLINFLTKVDPDNPLPLDGKSVGVVSVGAKRNGGQETTNIYALWDCLRLGATVVGNGPPTSQYGGTGWGGNIGAIIDDNFGLVTSKGTGHRLGILTKIHHSVAHDGPVRILFVVTRRDRHGEFLSRIRELQFSSNVTVDVLDLTDLSIKRCLACPVCPNGNLEADYTCIIPPVSTKDSEDHMQLVHSHLKKADGIVLSHYSGTGAAANRFQEFMERTRFVRRNDFELADRAFTVLTESSSLTEIYPLRFMTSFLRHNLFLMGPFYHALRDRGGRILMESLPLPQFTSRFEAFVRKTVTARRIKLNKQAATYAPVGYPEVEDKDKGVL